MTPPSILALALLVFTAAPAAAQNVEQGVRSHLESHVPAANDFHPFLQRDLNQFFTATLENSARRISTVF